MNGDLFDFPVKGGMTRWGGHFTSEAAAEAIKPVTGKIALAVLQFARERRALGFTDDELKAAYPNAPESSYRKRRTELTHRGLLTDSGLMRANRHGRDEIVWRVA